MTVPILWDTDQETIVSNESANIIRMLDEGFADVSGQTPAQVYRIKDGATRFRTRAQLWDLRMSACFDRTSA